MAPVTCATTSRFPLPVALAPSSGETSVMVASPPARRPSVGVAAGWRGGRRRVPLVRTEGGEQKLRAVLSAATRGARPGLVLAARLRRVLELLGDPAVEERSSSYRDNRAFVIEAVGVGRFVGHDPDLIVGPLQLGIEDPADLRFSMTDPAGAHRRDPGRPRRLADHLIGLPLTRTST